LFFTIVRMMPEILCYRGSYGLRFVLNLDKIVDTYRHFPKFPPKIPLHSPFSRLRRIKENLLKYTVN
jgi:hypothetical protein